MRVYGEIQNQSAFCWISQSGRAAFARPLRSDSLVNKTFFLGMTGLRRPPLRHRTKVNKTSQHVTLNRLSNLN